MNGQSYYITCVLGLVTGAADEVTCARESLREDTARIIYLFICYQKPILLQRRDEGLRSMKSD